MNSIKRKLQRSLYILRYQGAGALFQTVVQKAFGPGKDHAALEADMLSLPTAKERFNRIYADNLWGGDESLSGPGSTAEMTAHLRARLPELVRDYQIRSMVDAPCGDFAWMKLVLGEINIRYTGCDIVESVIDRNISLFAAPEVFFSVKDICSDPLPEADLMFVRDCLFHLSEADIGRFLETLAGIDYKYLMTTTHDVAAIEGFRNTDIKTGDFRRIDLFSAPYGFDRDSVLEEVNDYIDGHLPRSMVLLAKKDVPTSLRRA